MRRRISRKIASFLVILIIVYSALSAINIVFNIPSKVNASNGWLEAVKLNNLGGNCKEPEVAANGNNVHVVWVNNNGIFYKRSLDNGWTWSGEISLAGGSNPKIAVCGSNVHVLWDYGYIKSTDNGDTWSNTVNIFSGLYKVRGYDLAIYEDNVYVVAVEHIDYPPYDDYCDDFDLVQFKKSSTNGDSWESWVKIDGPSRDDVYEIAIVAKYDNIHVIYGLSPFDHDAFIRWFNHTISESGGSSWYPSYTINTGGMQKAGLSMSYSGGSVSMIWSEVAEARILQKTWSGGWFTNNDIGHGWGFTSVSEDYIIWSYSPIVDPTDIESNIDGILVTIEGYNGDREFFDIHKENGEVHFVFIDNYQVYYKHKGPWSELFITSSDIQFCPSSPIENGTSVSINAKVYNSGVVAQNVEVKFFNGNPDINGDLNPDVLAEIIGNDTIDFNGGESAIASVNWIPPSKDVYDIYVWVDPENTTQEYCYSNNLAPAAEDLMVFDWVDHFDNKNRVLWSENIKFHESDTMLKFNENATDWEYEYKADVEPELNGWELRENAATDLANASGGLLNLNTTPENAYWWYNYNWSASNSIGVTLEAKLKMEDTGPNSDLFLFVRDGSRYEGIQFFEDRVQGWYDQSLIHYMDTTDQFHIYRLTAKDDDFMVYVDGLLCINGIDKYLSSSSSNVAQFGDIMDTSGYHSWSNWDYIRFNTSGVIEPQYLLDGAVTSVDITLPFGYEWEELFIDKTEPPGTYINITILDGGSDNPIPGFIDLSESTIDLSSIDSDFYPSIKLQAIFRGTSYKSPILHCWALNYTPSSSIILKEGMNLISLPMIQSNTEIQAVLKSIEGQYDAVQWYNTEDINDPWKHYHILKSPNMNDLMAIDHTMGFWVHIAVPSGTTLVLGGLKPSASQFIPLHPGWNLVGYPSLSNKNRTKALNNLTFGTDVDSIWTFDATTQNWEEIGEQDYFEVGRGYWVHAINECIWEVPL